MTDEIQFDTVGKVWEHKDGSIRFTFTDPAVLEAVKSGDLVSFSLQTPSEKPKWNVDTFINSMILDAQDAAEAEIRKNIIEAFGSIEAFEEVADQYILEHKQETPLFDTGTYFRTLTDSGVRFRINTVWQIRKKTEEELAAETKEADVSTPDL